MEIGLLVLRVVIGALFVGHGTQKLFGWWGDRGLDGTSGFMESLGYRPGREHAIAAGVAEAGAGALLALGLFTPLAAAAVIGVMVNAVVAVHLPNGLWVTNGGYEYNLVLATAALTVAMTGPGNWSLDAAAGWELAGPLWGVVTLLLGIVFGGAVVAMRDEDAIAEDVEDDEDEMASHRAA